jgi:hypothetical protein
MDPKFVTVLIALSAAGCFAGGAFVPNPTAQASLFALGTFLLGVIGVSKPTDLKHVRRDKALARARDRGPDLTKVRKLP